MVYSKPDQHPFLSWLRNTTRRDGGLGKYIVCGTKAATNEVMHVEEARNLGVSLLEIYFELVMSITRRKEVLRLIRLLCSDLYNYVSAFIV